MTDIKSLQQVLIEELGRRTIESTVIPPSIADNINPALPMRPYQGNAFQFFVNYWQESFSDKPAHNHQVLFHMATGSGKTLLMAGLMSYLYEKGYRNFLFFVNSTNVIEKTRTNFLDHRSPKYLFANPISIGSAFPTVREVENFQASSESDINVVFSTIQGLHTSLNNPSENGITYEDFESQRVVLISDEAHHINATTKQGVATQEDLFEAQSWEGTVERIFRANKGNVLLEFTATVDFSDAELAKKYRPKLIFDYSLKEFRKDGYSKEVKVLQSDLLPVERALQAVLLSQYRRKVFERHKKHVKPVVLFKSKTIKDSDAFFDLFVSTIKGLNGTILSSIKSRTTDPSLRKLFAYLDKNDISLANFATEIKVDFAVDKLLSVNSKEDSELKQLVLNSLEAPDNEVRAVFAVDKLNEGWDVLNLFDIVRMYDTRDSRAGGVGKTTMSEAQLIGRGARYFPFQTTTEQPLFQRKYDLDVENELRVCEELYYHAAYNPKYIQELNTALQEIGIKAANTKQCSIRLKDSFRKSPLYKNGLVFLNRRQLEGSSTRSLTETLGDKRYSVQLRTGHSSTSLAFDGTTAEGNERVSRDYVFGDFGRSVLRTALNRNPFFEFSRLRDHLPQLRSMNDFISTQEYLAGVKVEVSGAKSEIGVLAPDDRLHIASVVLSEIESDIKAGVPTYKGTTEFQPRPIKDVFYDKTMNLVVDDASDKELGKSMNDSQSAYHLNLTKREWYVFDDCFGTSEEKALIQFIDKRQPDLRKNFSDVYLIRNEKHFQLFNFADGRPLEPDFLLYLVGKRGKVSVHYQVFVEPKGGHLLKADEWKQSFLTSLQDEAKLHQLFSDRKFVVWGLPFYNDATREAEFVPAFDHLLANA